jgi:vanillate O-demethylase monooxygenase subunit
MADSVRGAFEEDRAILNAVQKSFDESRTPHIDIAIDSAPLRFRRRLRQMIVAEQPPVNSAEQAEQTRDPA